MSNDKAYNRHINIWINGKEVKNNIASIRGEAIKLTNELAQTTRGTKEYYEKSAELKKINAIIGEHNAGLRTTKSSIDNLKSGFSEALGKISIFTASVYGAFQSIKGIISSTEGASDKLNEILAGSKEAFWQLQNSIATLDFSNFFSKLKEAYIRGKELEQQLDNLADQKAYSDYKIASLNRGKQSSSGND